MPSQAREELDSDPDRAVLRVMELRAYARTKAARDQAKTANEMPTGELADLVGEIETDLWRERKQHRGR